MRADSFGLMGMAKSATASSGPAGYVLGLELEKRGGSMRTPDDFIDYYEVLQISPKADNRDHPSRLPHAGGPLPSR